MQYSVENVTSFLAIMSLLFVAIITVWFCKKDHHYNQTEKELLFAGRTPLHSFSSNLGSIFSVTYFFGAAFIYGGIYKSPLLIVTIFTTILIWFTVKKIITKIGGIIPEVIYNDNMLIAAYMKLTSKQNFLIIVYMYLAIYFLLLVEEIAVTRLVLGTLLPNTPISTTLLISIILYVVVTYVYVGGLRGVLNSDLVQMIILALFIFVLLFQMASANTSRLINTFSIDININYLVTLAGICLLYFSWLTTSLDIYSRLNFEETGLKLNLQRKRLIVVKSSLIFIIILVCIGLLFGNYLGCVAGGYKSPSEYTKVSIDYFLSLDNKLFIVVFCISLYCMIFTTIDTLVLMILQCGYYVDYFIFNRKNIITIILVATFCASLMSYDSVSVIGIFFGSMLVAGLFPVLQILLFPKCKLFPHTLWYIPAGLCIFLVYFAYNYSRLKLQFDLHFYLPIIVAASLISCGLISKLFELIREDP